MDFWDITKLLARRWKIALPLLLVSAVFTTVTVIQVKPDYVGTAYVQLVPPAAPKSTNPEGQLASAEQRNPWLDQGLQTLGNAAIVQVLDLSVVQEFERTGYADTYTVTMGSNTPLVTFEITGNSARQSRDTAEKLVTIFTDSVARLQSSLGVKDENLITVKRLDLGANVKKSTSKVKRALVAVAVAGILLSAGLTIAIDAWLRRRRKSGDAEADEPEATSATTRLPTGGTPPSSWVNPTDTGLTVEYQQPAKPIKPIKPVDGRDRTDQTTIIPIPDADSTVVLPLSALPPKQSAKPGKSS